MAADEQIEWSSGPGSGFSFACPCGRTSEVSTAQAGTETACGCGRAVKVPNLSTLRTLAGRDRYESGVVDEIKRMIRTGGLPSVNVCAWSKQPTADIAKVSILMPRFFKDQEKDDWKIALLMGWVALLIKRAIQKTYFEEEGAQTIEVPLRLDAALHAKVRRLSQKRLRRLLRIEPLYDRLMKENPHCQLTILG